MPSNNYHSLKKNIRLLQKHLLPGKFNELGEYRERVFTGVVAFRVLCHAAIEEYFEDRVIEIARHAYLKCRDFDRLSRTAACLIAFSGSEMRAPPSSLQAPQQSQQPTWPLEIDVKEKIGLCASKFINRTKFENHGVREKNILSLLLPIGYNVDSIDGLFLSEIDNFGKSRGEYAHSSVTNHVTTKPNPKDELDRVNSLLEMMLAVDVQLDSLLEEVK